MKTGVKSWPWSYFKIPGWGQYQPTVPEHPVSVENMVHLSQVPKESSIYPECPAKWLNGFLPRPFYASPLYFQFSCTITQPEMATPQTHNHHSTPANFKMNISLTLNLNYLLFLILSKSFPCFTVNLVPGMGYSL